MNGTNLMDYIPPEQIAILVTAIVGLVVAVIAFFVWLIRFVPKLIESKLSQSQAEMQAKLDEAKIKNEMERLELQNQLDQTQSSREMMRLQISESEQTRAALLKIIEAMREDAKNIGEQYARFMKETSESYKGINANTASTLELLKLHQETDETMEIKQEKLIAQNDKTHSQNETTHEKLSALTTTLAEIVAELKKVTGGRASDREILNDIQSKLLRLQEDFATIEAIARTPPQAVATTTQPSATNVTPPEINENQKELKKEDSQ